MKQAENKGITRRQAAAGILVPAAVQAQAPVTSEDELAAARQQVQRNAEQLRKMKTPVAAEPSFLFRP